MSHQASESATSDGGSSIHSLGIAGAGGRAFSPAQPLDASALDGNASRQLFPLLDEVVRCFATYARSHNSTTSGGIFVNATFTGLALCYACRRSRGIRSGSGRGTVDTSPAPPEAAGDDDADLQATLEASLQEQQRRPTPLPSPSPPR